MAGLGLIGGSLLRALGGTASTPRRRRARAAAAEGFAVADSLAGLAGSDLVIVAVPPAACVDVVREALARRPWSPTPRR